MRAELAVDFARRIARAVAGPPREWHVDYRIGCVGVRHDDTNGLSWPYPDDVVWVTGRGRFRDALAETIAAVLPAKAKKARKP